MPTTNFEKLGLLPAQQKIRHPKILVFGQSGSGKSWFACSAGTEQEPAIILDSEGGTHFYGPETGHHFLRKDTQSIFDALDVLEALRADGGHCPVCLDSGTIFWQVGQEAVQDKLRVDELKFQHWRKVKAPFKRMYAMAMSLSRPVIITAQESSTYDVKKNELVVTGYKPSFEGGAEYAFDLVLRMVKKGDSRVADVYKSRIGSLPVGKIIDDPSYQKIVAMADVYGRAGNYAVASQEESAAGMASRMDDKGDMSVTLMDVQAIFREANTVEKLDKAARSTKVKQFCKLGEQQKADVKTAYDNRHTQLVAWDTAFKDMRKWMEEYVGSPEKFRDEYDRRHNSLYHDPGKPEDGNEMLEELSRHFPATLKRIGG